MNFELHEFFLSPKNVHLKALLYCQNDKFHGHYQEFKSVKKHGWQHSIQQNAMVPLNLVK